MTCFTDRTGFHCIFGPLSDHTEQHPRSHDSPAADRGHNQCSSDHLRLELCRCQDRLAGHRFRCTGAPAGCTIKQTVAWELWDGLGVRSEDVGSPEHGSGDDRVAQQQSNSGTLPGCATRIRAGIRCLPTWDSTCQCADNICRVFERLLPPGSEEKRDSATAGREVSICYYDYWLLCMPRSS